MRAPTRDDPYNPEDPDEWDRLYAPRHAEAAWPEAIVEDNPVVAELLGPDGYPIHQMRERRHVPFGFQRPARRPAGRVTRRSF